jgi:DNA-3-methyladenine glycosylase
MSLNDAVNYSTHLHDILPIDFYSRSALETARNLIGKLLVRSFLGQLMAGMIIETEAYQGEQDLGCHAKAGLTPRTKVMYGPPGHAYIYFTYGMHWMLNAVCCPEGSPAAVLIRGIEPVFGLDSMRSFRHQPSSSKPGSLNKGWTDGPAKLCQALSLDGKLNGINLCDMNSDIWISNSSYSIPKKNIIRTPRIGMNNVPEPWKSIPWRFLWELPKTLDPE